MLIRFFYFLREQHIPVSIQEFIMLIQSLSSPAAALSIDDFYYLARLILIKDERLFDRYDKAFALFYTELSAEIATNHSLPSDWLIQNIKKHLSTKEKAQLQKHDLADLIELFKKTLAEQTERHAGGSKWIGTGGSSPFGHGGYHPQGIRLGGSSTGNQTAIKVWEERHYQDYDDQRELGTRNLKVALRKLRRFTRDGAATELDLPATIHRTAQQAGLLTIQQRAERRNAVNVLMLLDVGGSMDFYIQQVEELFSAARSEYKHLEVLYFHNCPYEWLWKNNQRRFEERISTADVLAKYNEDWRVIFVGDATMSPFEISHVGGAVDHHNAETGAVWLQRFVDKWPKLVWLNPTAAQRWMYHQSTLMIRQLTQDRMFPVTVQGLESAMHHLTK